MAGAVRDLFYRTNEELKNGAIVYKKPFCIVVSAGNDGLHVSAASVGLRFRAAVHSIDCPETRSDAGQHTAYRVGCIEGLITSKRRIMRAGASMFVRVLDRSRSLI